MENHGKTLTNIQKAVIQAVQDDIPVVAEPFRAIAERLGIEEEALLEIIRQMKECGLIRRFGATLRHQRVGFKANAMSLWRVPEHDIERVGRLIASLPEVTHCYERIPHPQLSYNLYAMIHGRSKRHCESIARRIAEEAGVEDYILLFSNEENKKESMRYF
jgi:DNA-binding Lrp family transcriptional regulator